MYFFIVMVASLIILMIMLNSFMGLKGAHFRFDINVEDFKMFLRFTTFSSLCCLTSLYPLFKCLHLSVGVSNAEAGSRYDSQMEEGAI